MKLLLFLLLAGLMLTAGSAPGTRNQQTEAATTQGPGCGCIGVRAIRGDNCGTPDSFRIEFRNVCSYGVNSQIYVRWSPMEPRQRAARPIPLGPGQSAWYFWCSTPYEVFVACE